MSVIRFGGLTVDAQGICYRRVGTHEGYLGGVSMDY
jgi:hypothetical protein